MAILIDGGDRLLPDEARDQRARARAIADEVIAPIAADIDRDRHIPSAIRRQLAEAGFYGLNIPPEWGGKGSTLLAAVTIEELSRASAAVGLSVAVQVLGSTPFILGGNREQADHWLPDLAAGRRFCSFAMTEPGSGTDAASVATMLTETGDGFQLNGEKHFISGATLSDVYTVIARSGAGRNEMTAVVVPADTPGFVIGPVQPFTGMRGMPVGRLQFIDAPVQMLGTGWVASAGALIYCAAPRERRFCLPNTRFLLHEPRGGVGGMASDVEIQAREILRMRERLNKIFAEATGQPVDKIKKDVDRDYWMLADEAKAYGLVGRIVNHQRELS